MSTKYHEFYRQNCHSLDAMTFTQIKTQIFAFLRDERCPDDVKLLFGDWLFRKIFMSSKPRPPVRQEVCEQLESAVRKCKAIAQKGTYLRFHDVVAMSLIALHFYENRFEEEKTADFVLQLLNDTQLLKNYFQDPRFRSDRELKTHFLQWIKQAPLLDQRSNLLDVLLLNFRHDPDVQTIHERMRWKGDKPGTLYDDAQNVHDPAVQKSTIEATAEFLKWYDVCVVAEKRRMYDDRDDPASWAEAYLLKHCPAGADKTVLHAVVERVRIDTTSFSGEGRSFTIADILFALLHYIEFSEAKTTLMEILLDEMKQMVSLCTSGYVARFMSTLRGFDDRFQITTSPESQLHSSLAWVLAKAMEKAPEAVALGTIDEEHRAAYLRFVQQIVAREIPRWIKDYGAQDVSMYIVSAVHKVSGYDVWRLEKGAGRGTFKLVFSQ